MASPISWEDRKMTWIFMRQTETFRANFIQEKLYSSTSFCPRGRRLEPAMQSLYVNPHNYASIYEDSYASIYSSSNSGHSSSLNMSPSVSPFSSGNSRNSLDHGPYDHGDHTELSPASGVYLVMQQEPWCEVPRPFENGFARNGFSTAISAPDHLHALLELRMNANAP